jgi:hypothetical protein
MSAYALWVFQSRDSVPRAQRTPAVFTTGKEVGLLNTILSPENFCVFSIIPLTIFKRVLWLCVVRLKSFTLEGAYALGLPWILRNCLAAVLLAVKEHTVIIFSLITLLLMNVITSS